MKEYDAVILGAGPGGYVSAIRAAQLGAKTAIIEKGRIGGACLNTGCIPTKALIKNVEILHHIALGKERGILVPEVRLDFKQAIEAKNRAVKRLTGGVEALLLSNGVDLYLGKGVVQKNKELLIVKAEGKNEVIKYKKLIIATGSRPSRPPIKGIETSGIVTSDELLHAESVPRKLLIIGGGVIGCEFACVFSAYGSKVTVIEMQPELVGMMDADISSQMAAILAGQGVSLKLGRQVKEIASKADGFIEITVTNGKQEELLHGDKALICAGREPNYEGLEALRLKTEKGFIKINEKLQTSVKDVYAIGDVTGKRQLAHVASEMGIYAAENAMGAERAIKLDFVPSCIYTIPEVGSVGLSEKEAREQGYNVAVGRFPLLACGKAVAAGDTEGMFKIVADKNTRKILGAQLIGKSATELVAEITAYLKMGAVIEDIIDTIHAHPTISESIAEAVRDIDGRCIHMPRI